MKLMEGQKSGTLMGRLVDEGTIPNLLHFDRFKRKLGRSFMKLSIYEGSFRKEKLPLCNMNCLHSDYGLF